MRWEPTIPPQTEQRLSEKMALGHFGRPDGWYDKLEAETKWPGVTALEERTVGGAIQVHLPAEFTVQIVDLSTDADYLLKAKKIATRETKETCNRAIAEDLDVVELINRCMIAIDRIFVKIAETPPAKYANMKTKIEPYTIARDTKISAIQACTTFEELRVLMGWPTG